MSEETRKQEYTPLNLHPFVGLDLGERWGREVGELSQRLTHVEQSVARLEVKTDTLSAKVEEIVHTLARHEERFNSLDEKLNSLEKRFDERFISLEKRQDDKFRHIDDKFTQMDDKFTNLFAGLEKSLAHNNKMLWGMFTAMLAAIIIQKFI